MKVTREPPSDKIQFRVNAPLRIDIGNRNYRVADWNIDGFTIANFSALQASSTPVVGLADNAADTLRQAALDAGMVEVSNKAIGGRELLDLIQCHIRSIDGNTPSLAQTEILAVHATGTHAELEGESETHAAFSNAAAYEKKILLADSDPAVRSAFRSILANSHFRLSIVEDGQAAIEVLKYESFDLIFLDIRMPKMEGLEAARAIRSQGSKFADGHEFECTLHIPFQEFDVSFQAMAVVEGYTRHGELKAKFAHLGTRERSALEYFLEELVRGSMTAIDDIIVHIDQPVELVNPTPPPVEESARGVLGFRRKLLFTSCCYLVIGIGVLFYIALLVDRNFYRLEVESAVVSAPIKPIYATHDGRLESFAAALGASVRQNSKLMEIENAALEKDVANAIVDVQEAESSLRRHRQQVAAQRAHVDYAKDQLQQQIELSEVRIDTLRKLVSLAERELERIRQIHASGHNSKSVVNEAEFEYTDILGQLTAETKRKNGLTESLAAFESGKAFAGKDRLIESQAQVELAVDRLLQSQVRLRNLYDQRARLGIRAPEAGRLLKISRPPGTYIKKDQVVAYFEYDEQRIVRAFLSQDEILQIGLGDRAMVYFPALSQRIAATVEAIDRTSAFVEELQARYTWRGPADRTAIVELSIDDADYWRLEEKLKPGLPAIVLFSRRDTLELRSRFREWFDSQWAFVSDSIFEFLTPPEPLQS